MRALLARCLFSLLVATNITAIVAWVHAGELPQHEQLSRQPIIEVAAFGAAPVGVVEDNHSGSGAEDMLHRATAPDFIEGQPREVETRVLFGETWGELLNRVNDKLGSDALISREVTSQIGLLPALEPGKYIRFRSAGPGHSVQIEYVVTSAEAYSITLNAVGVQVQRHASDPRVVERMRADPSKASLFTATDAIGLPEEIVLQLVDIFSDEVDFQRELHQGYQCTIVYEVLYSEGHIDRPGRILAAELVIHDRRLQAFYFNDGRGRAGYYTAAGKNMKKVFRKSPVEFSRVTSDFTLARFHPILGLWRAHRGVDYAAPIDSKVLATANGVVEFMGERGELGNLVVLRHYGRFLTYYGHLHGFAAGLAVGDQVEKGQVIGYVGMTGLTTGPHVHYEFRVDDGSGQRLGIPIPPPEVLEEPPIQTAAFLKVVQSYRDQLQVAQKAHLVILD